MRRFLLALMLLTAMTVPAHALLTYPPGFVCEGGNSGEVCVGVDIKPDVSNGNALVTSYREVSVLDSATTSAGSTTLTIRATELIDPQIHSPYVHFITESRGKAQSVDDGTRCGPEHFWSMDGFIWRTTQSDYNGDDDKVTPVVHNGIYRIEAITDGAWWNVGPNYQENCGSPKEKIDITAEKIVYVNNLVVRDLETPRVLIWKPGASFPVIPVTISDAGSMENTEIKIRIYPLCYDKMYWLSPDKPARTIQTTINGSTSIIWDALDDRGQQVPPGIYVYKIRTSHTEKDWTCPQGTAPSWWSPCDCSKAERTEAGSTTLSYLDIDIRNSDLKISDCTAAEISNPNPPTTSGNRAIQLNYSLSGSALVCGLRVYGPDLVEIPQLNRDDLPVASGTHNVRVDVPVSVLGDYYFVVYAKDPNRNNKGHLIKPALEQGAVWHAGQSTWEEYDNSNGFRKTMKDFRGTTTYDFDVLGRLIHVTDPDDSSIHYEYNLNDNRTKMIETLRGGTTYTTTYDYTTRGQLWHIYDRHGGTTTFTYDEIGLPDQVTYPNGTYEKYEFNSCGLLLSKSNMKSDGITIIAKFDYGYDYDPAHGKWGRDGSVTSITENILNPDDTRIQSRTDLEIYDLLVRETRTGNFPYSVDYTYDPAANTLNEVIGGQSTLYAFDPAYKVLSAGGKIFTYDDIGNVLTELESGVVTKYGYDIDNRVNQVERGGIVQAQFLYDGNGATVRRIIDGEACDYRIDPTTGAALSEESDGVMTYYVQDTEGSLISTVKDSEVLYYHFDANGNTYALTTTGPNAWVSGSASYGHGREKSYTSGNMGNQPYQHGGSGGEYTVPDEYEICLVQIGGAVYNCSGSHPGYNTAPNPGRQTCYITFDQISLLRMRRLYFAIGLDPCSEPIDWFAVSENAMNFTTGMGDSLSFGATRLFRRAWGYDDVVDADSGWYIAGDYTGTAVGSIINPSSSTIKTVGLAKNTSRVAKVLPCGRKVCPWVIEKQHWLMKARKFLPHWRRMRVDIEEYTEEMFLGQHRLKDFDGIHTGQDNLYSVLSLLFRRKPNATLQDVLEEIAEFNRRKGRSMPGI